MGKNGWWTLDDIKDLAPSTIIEYVQSYKYIRCPFVIGDRIVHLYNVKEEGTLPIYKVDSLKYDNNGGAYLTLLNLSTLKVYYNYRHNCFLTWEATPKLTYAPFSWGGII